MPDEEAEQKPAPAPEPVAEERRRPLPVQDLIRDPQTLEVILSLSQRKNGVFRELPVNMNIRLRRPPVRELMVQVRLSAPHIPDAQKAAWNSAVRETWSGAVFIDLRNRREERYPILFDLQWFEAPGRSARSSDPGRDFGHLLGNPEESGDVEFTNLGATLITILWDKAPFLPGVMRESKHKPRARNYFLIGVKTAEMLGIPFPASTASEWRISVGQWRHTGDYHVTATN